MQVSVESTGDIERKVNVEVPAERMDKEFDKQIKSMRGKVRIDGFRPGKVPLSVVKQRYGEAVYNDVVGQVLQETLYEAIGNENLKIAGAPQVTPEVMELGKDLKYSATVEIYPEVSVADLTGLEVTKPVVEIVDADIDTMIDVLRKQQQTWEETDRAAKDDDQVTLDFEGTLEGEVFEGGTAEGYEFQLGAGRMLPDFEAAVQGMAKGDEKVADVSFPDDYQAENLKGKTVQFKLNVTKVSEPVLPEVDEEFIKKFGVEDGSVDTFRSDVTKNMQRELKQAVAAKVKNAVMDGLFDMHEVEVPKALVKNEIDLIRNEMQQNTGTDTSTLPDSLFEDQAFKRVKLGLVVGEMINENDIQKDEERVQAMISDMAESYEDPQAVIDYYSSDPQARQSIEAAVMEETIVDWVLERAKVSEETMDFDSVMSEARAGNAAM